MTMFKAGNRVKIDHFLYKGEGTIIQTDDGGYILETDGTNRSARSDGTLWSTPNYLTLIDEIKTKEGDDMGQTFKVGDRVEVKDDFPFYNGTGTVVSSERGIFGNPVYLIDTDGPNRATRSDGYVYVFEEDLTLIGQSGQTFEAGEKAIVKHVEHGTMTEFVVGEVVTVKGPSFAGNGRLEIINDETYGYCAPSCLEKIEEDEGVEMAVAEAPPECPFKVGDIVKGVSNNPYRLTTEDMTKGEVTEVLDYDEIKVKIVEGTPGSNTEDRIGHTFTVDPKYFELAPKFKVGDIVRGLPASNTKYGITNENMTKGEVTEVNGKYVDITLIESADSHDRRHYIGTNFTDLDGDVFEVVDEKDTKEDEISEAPKKRYIRMIGDDLGYKDGDVLELDDDGAHFVDNDGDERFARYHKFEEIEGEVTFVDTPINREKVTEFLSDISTDELIDIIIEARK